MKYKVEYGRTIEVSEGQMSEWLDDLEQAVDESMHTPLHVGSRDAWHAPEVIRGKVFLAALREHATDKAMARNED